MTKLRKDNLQWYSHCFRRFFASRLCPRPDFPPAIAWGYGARFYPYASEAYFDEEGIFLEESFMAEVHKFVNDYQSAPKKEQ